MSDRRNEDLQIRALGLVAVVASIVSLWNLADFLQDQQHMGYLYRGIGFGALAGASVGIAEYIGRNLSR